MNEKRSNDMNKMQRYSRELVAANEAVADRPGVALIWRGQVIERLAPGDDDTVAGESARLSGGGANLDRASRSD